MQLSKKEKQSLIQNLLDNDVMADYASLLCCLSDHILLAHYKDTFPDEVCEHCDHVPATGACFYCKMD